MPNTRPRAVTFSQFSELAFIPKDDIESKWYSKQETHGFRRALVRDAKQMSRQIEDAPADAMITLEQLYECIGIEVYVTKGLAKDVAKTRRAHVDAVLSEQSLQKRQGVCDLCDIEKLASVSKTRSRWTEVRARKLATGYQWE